MKESNTKINLEIPKTLVELLKAEATEREMSISGLVRLIIKEHFQNKK